MKFYIRWIFLPAIFSCLFADIIDRNQNPLPEELVDPALRIAEVINDGQTLILSDDSKWEIAPEYQNIAAGWLGASEVSIKKVSDKGEYNYSIYNHWTESEVLARPATNSH